MQITRRRLKQIIQEEKLRMSIRNILTEASDTKFGVWEFKTDDYEGVAEYPLHPTLKDYDGQHKYGVMYIGDLTIEVKPEYTNEDPSGGRDFEFYNIGYIIEADDSAPSAGGNAGSRKRYVGRDGKAYRTTGSYYDREAKDFQVFGSFDEAYKAANIYVAAYMKEKGLKPGQGESEQRKADRATRDRYFSY